MYKMVYLCGCSLYVEVPEVETELIGSFVLSLAVPTGLESAVRNWFIEWVSMMRMIVLSHL